MYYLRVYVVGSQRRRDPGVLVSANGTRIKAGILVRVDCDRVMQSYGPGSVALGPHASVDCDRVMQSYGQRSARPPRLNRQTRVQAQDVSDLIAVCVRVRVCARTRMCRHR